MVPALKNADDLSIIEITQQIEELAKSAQKRNINPDLLSSEAASFSISNLEGYGVEMFTPVINLPQVAILGINAIQLKPIDTGKGNIEFIPHIGLSLTYDHRALDGGPATMFLRLVKQEIERFSQSII
jgi:pyruvate dehydrogenase E2 component (dihydrolipoamide acetyltransferase)